MARRQRKTSETYYDMLNWFFNKLEYTGLSLSEIGLMNYIMHQCNLNYGNECIVNLKVVAAKSLADVRRLPGKLQTLANKNYIKCVELEQNVWQISVKCQTFANEQQGVEPISEDKIREEKTREEKKIPEKIDIESIDIKSIVDWLPKQEPKIIYSAIAKDIIESCKICDRLKLSRETPVTKTMIDLAIQDGYRVPSTYVKYINVD